MPPEQAKGLTESIDRRSDVFALGAVLCEILTGAPPYADDDDRTRLERARQGDTAEAFARLDGCSADRELVDLTRDCLAIDPAARPADANHVWQRLNAFLRGLQEKLQKIELERAEARARAQERRRRRRIVLTLAACLILLLGLLGTAGAWFAQREAARRRDEAVRRDQIQQQLAETLDEVEQLYAEAPEDWREDPLRRTRIRELARRAETLSESPWSPPTAVQRGKELRDRIEAEDADGRLLDRLEAIRLESAKVNPRTDKFATGRTRPLYRYAFNNYGLDLDKVDAQSAVEKIRSRPAHVVEACVFGLGKWRSLFKSSTVPQSQWIDAVLDGIDDDPWRRAVRQACREKDWNAVGELLQTARGEHLSVDAINFVAMELMDEQQFDLARELLQMAQSEYPGDFWINQYLGLAYYSLPDDRYEEAVRFITAALAIRETDTGYLILGWALSELRRDAEAEQAFRSALRLQPEYVQARLFLAEVLERQGRTAEAAAWREEAAQLQTPEKTKTSVEE